MGDLFSPQQSGTTTVTQNTQPWKEQIPYLTRGFQRAEQLYNAPGPNYFPHSTIAGPSATTLAAQDAQAGRAITGSPLNDAAKTQIMGTLGGEYLNNNPYLAAMARQNMEAIRPMIDSQFAGNSYGSSAHQAAATDAYTRSLERMGFENYNNERARQMAAVDKAPNIANTDYQDIGALADVGRQQDAQAQAQLGDLVSRFNFNENRPQMKLGQYMGNISGSYGNTSSQATPYYTNPAAGIMGAALGGAKMAGMGK